MSSIKKLSFDRKKHIIPLNILLKLNHILKKSIFSRNFYQQINDKVLTNSKTVDTNLYFICYFTLLVSSILENKSNIRRFLIEQKCNVLKLISSFAKRNFDKDLKESSNKFIAHMFMDKDFDPDQISSEESSKCTSILAKNLKNVSSYLSDIRIFNRLTSSIEIIPWLADEFQSFISQNTSVPKFDRFVNMLQALNCLILEILENAGWVTDHNWINTSDNTHWSEITYVWSSRVWGAYLAFEIFELLRRTPGSKWNKDWKISIFQQLIQLPLVLHWSLYEGCLTPFWVGLCGSGASWFQFKDMWRSIKLE